MGERSSQMDIPLEWLDQLGSVVVSADDLLAPEATGTSVVDDCFRSLLWAAERTDERASLLSGSSSLALARATVSLPGSLW